MRKLETKAPVRLRGIVTAIAAMVLTVSLGNLSQAETAIAQTPLKVDQFIAPEQPDPANARPITRKLCPSALEAAIAAIVDRSNFNTAQWGILIEPLSEPTVLYKHDADAFLIPASNVKLLTTAAALQIVGDRIPLKRSAFEQWVTEINRDSDNDLADALLRRIGGQSAVRQALTTLGVNPNGYQQVDGSGLSRNNRAKPSTFVELLKEMYIRDETGLFYNSLSVAGVSGTLRHRFRDTPVQGKVHAKTGTLNGVKALSGYLENVNYGTIAFSIVVNQPGQSDEVLTEAIDQIVLETAQVDRCH